jgi:hypothetical protein
VRFGQDKHMIDARRINPISLSAKPFCQRGAWGDGLVADAHGAQSERDGSAVDPIRITDQVAGALAQGNASVTGGLFLLTLDTEPIQSQCMHWR